MVPWERGIPPGIASNRTHTLRALSHVHIVLLPQARRQRSESVSPSGFLCQPLQSFLHKALEPLVGMATAHANRSGYLGDRHPSARSKIIRARLARPAGMSVER